MEAKTGFQKDGGTKDRNCHFCKFMRGSICTQPVMMEFSRQPRDSAGMPYVDKGDVCDYFSAKSSVARLLRVK